MKYERTDADQQLIERAWAIVRRKPQPVLDAGRWLDSFTPVRCRAREAERVTKGREAWAACEQDPARRLEIQESYSGVEADPAQWNLKHYRFSLAWSDTFHDDNDSAAHWFALPQRDKLELAGRMVLLVTLATCPDADDLLKITTFHKGWPWTVKHHGEMPDFEAEGDKGLHRYYTGKCLTSGWGVRPLWLDKLELAVRLLDDATKGEPSRYERSAAAAPPRRGGSRLRSDPTADARLADHYKASGQSVKEFAKLQNIPYPSLKKALDRDRKRRN